MGKIEKTASGKYRMRVYSAKAGCTKSFTHAKKSVVQSMADEWLKSLETRPLSEKTFAECVEDYISMKSNILSPMLHQILNPWFYWFSAKSRVFYYFQNQNNVQIFNFLYYFSAFF